MGIHTNIRGQGLVEYIIIVLVIGVGAIAAIASLKGHLKTKIEKVGTEVQQLDTL